MRRYRVAGLCRKDPEPDSRPFYVRILMTDSTAGDGEFARFVDINIDEAIDAFQQGWIELESEVAPKYNRTM